MLAERGAPQTPGARLAHGGGQGAHVRMLVVVVRVPHPVAGAEVGAGGAQFAVAQARGADAQDG